MVHYGIWYSQEPHPQAGFSLSLDTSDTKTLWLRGVRQSGVTLPAGHFLGGRQRPELRSLRPPLRCLWQHDICGLLMPLIRPGLPWDWLPAQAPATGARPGNQSNSLRICSIWFRLKSDTLVHASSGSLDILNVTYIHQRWPPTAQQPGLYGFS